MLLLLPWRRILAAACVVGAFGWVLVGPQWVDRTTRSPANWERQILAPLAKEDPALARQLAQLKNGGAIAGLDAMHQLGGTSALRRAAELEQQHVQPALTTLTALAQATGAGEQRDEFLRAHGTVIQALDPLSPQAAEYADMLETSMADPKLAPMVRDDPVAVLVFHHVHEDSLRQFYHEQRDWLAEPLVQLQPLVHSAKAEQLAPVIAVAQRYFPMSREIVQQHGLGAPGLQLLLAMGPVLGECVQQDKLPLDQTCEVLFCNRAILEKLSPREQRELLRDVYRQHPSVWKAAKLDPLALAYYREVPNLADRLMQKYGGEGVVPFLYAHYSAELPIASEAILQFNDVALYVLNRYKEFPRFHTLLQKIGTRAVPYVAQFGDGGIDRLEANRNWLDKYFDDAGNPKDKEWWTHVPILGAPVDVIRNYSNGYPNEWSELGWAAWDVADGALLIASLGTSETVTLAAKTAAKEAAEHAASKVITRLGALGIEEATEQTVKRTAVRSLAEAEARAGAAQVSRSVARDAFQRGLSESLLRRSLRYVGEGTFAAGRMLAIGGHFLAAPAIRAVELGHKVLQTWTMLPVGVRKLVCRGMFAVGLYVSIRERVLPNLGKIGDGMAELVTDVGRKALEATQAQLAASLNKLMTLSNHWTTGQWAGMMLPLVALPLGAFFLWPRGARAHAWSK